MRSIGILVGLMCVPAYSQYLKPLAPQLDPLKEHRICGKPKRTSNGEIFRSSEVIYAYRKIHPCPSTGRHEGACPNWAIDHIIPLAKGGCDAVTNMAWMPLSIKSCNKAYCIDRWERTYYGNPYGVVTLPE